MSQRRSRAVLDEDVDLEEVIRSETEYELSVDEGAVRKTAKVSHLRAFFAYHVCDHVLSLSAAGCATEVCAPTC